MLRTFIALLGARFIIAGSLVSTCKNNAMRLDELVSCHAQRRSLVVLWLPAADHRR